MSNPSLTIRPEALLTARSLTTAELRAQGIGKLRLRSQVACGHLLRVRTGRYVAAETDHRLVTAARYGGRLGCVSLLHALGVFVRDHQTLHLHIDRGASRLPPRPDYVAAHWREPDLRDTGALTTDVIDAVVSAVRCQSPRDAIATLDSAWHQGFLHGPTIAEVFRRLPERYCSLRPLLDPQSEAGSESLMRLLLRALGHHVEVQVVIPGVGRVDLLVDGWLIVECDSKEYHSDWTVRRKDLRRDLAAARLGYTTVRPLAEDILYVHDDMVATMRDVLAHARRG